MDGLRGLAAMAVVMGHSSFIAELTVPNAQSAVDLFFILSGFVIGFSYDEKLSRGMSAGQFGLRRFIRLYPMLLIGTVGGIAIAVIHNLTNLDHAYPPISILISGGLSILVLPYLGQGIPTNTVFSFNAPIWSLFFEIWANVAYAIFQRWLSIPVLMTLTIGALIVIGIMGPLGGAEKDTMVSGIPRVIAGFFGGLLLYKLWISGRVPQIRGNLVTLGIIIFALFLSPIAITGWFFIPVFALLCLIVLASANAAPSRLDNFSSIMGEASYPIYLVHWLTLYFVTFLGKKLGLGEFIWIAGFANVAIIPFVGIAFYRYYEKPAMSLLRRFIKIKSDPQTGTDQKIFAPAAPATQANIAV